MITLYHSNASTGEIYETLDVTTKEEKDFRMSPAGGGWWETPRWWRNPKPAGFDPSNPFEAHVNVPYEEFPRVLHKFTHVDKDTKEPVFKTMTVKSAEDKATALKAGWQLAPVMPTEKKETVSA